MLSHGRGGIATPGVNHGHEAQRVHVTVDLESEVCSFELSELNTIGVV